MKKIEKIKWEIKVLEKKLELLEEIERHNAKPKMNLENEGEFDIVSYDGYVYYRLQLPTDACWYVRIEDSAGSILLENISNKTIISQLESQWLMNDVKYQNDDEPYCPDKRRI
jgi:hypothetical protein